MDTAPARQAPRIDTCLDRFAYARDDAAQMRVLGWVSRRRNPPPITAAALRAMLGCAGA